MKYNLNGMIEQTHIVNIIIKLILITKVSKFSQEDKIENGKKNTQIIKDHYKNSHSLN